MKKLAILFVSALAITTVAVVAQPAQAAIKCAQATAKAHTPGKVAQPSKAANPLPKKFTFDTNCGVIEVSLNAKAPITITSLAALIRGKYYDNSLCHRLTTQGLYVLQCGDPTLTGAGNPTGWKGYKDENLPKGATNNYPAGTVAMANSGPGTNGSQFFIVSGPHGVGLPPQYSLFGQVVKGLPVFDGRFGDDPKFAVCLHPNDLLNRFHVVPQTGRATFHWFARVRTHRHWGCG